MQTRLPARLSALPLALVLPTASRTLPGYGVSSIVARFREYRHHQQHYHHHQHYYQQAQSIQSTPQPLRRRSQLPYTITLAGRQAGRQVGKVHPIPVVYTPR